MEAFRSYISEDGAGARAGQLPPPEDTDLEVLDAPESACDESEECDPMDGAVPIDESSAPLGDVLEDVMSRSCDTQQGPLPAGAEWKRMSGVVRDFNKSHLNPQALQTHRKFRFIGQQLFNAAHANNPAETKDGYHELRLNHDVAVMLEVQVVTGTRNGSMCGGLATLLGCGCSKASQKRKQLSLN